MTTGSHHRHLGQPRVALSQRDAALLAWRTRIVTAF
jgi:hypothetical protein